jgi:putative addiction module CopG family antidote
VDATKRLDIELPEDLAEAVSARVASGRFASASEVIQEGLRLLDEQESDPLEEWLRAEVAERCRRMEDGEVRLLSGDELRADLERRRAQTDEAA